MNEDSLLRYADERDKSYGIAGMTITPGGGRADDLLAEINLDAEPADALVMSHDFGFRGNPRMSAKIVWSQALDELRTTTSMALGNIVCRRYVLARRGLSKEDTEAIRSAVRSEAAAHCSLDTDEADALFERALATVDRIFRHSVVHDAARQFANELSARRSMSAHEAVELLASFGLR
ncbi:MAG: hypothetical protein K2L75_06060 [Muribaculaceae bacterium]|nr:hypothetical protein [Muribaculaceae bacterium]